MSQYYVAYSSWLVSPAELLMNNPLMLAHLYLHGGIKLLFS